MLGGLDWGKRMYTCNRRRAIKLIPAKASDKFTVRDFRQNVLRELKKIKDAWPDLHYAIAPSQLRLVEIAAGRRT